MDILAQVRGILQLRRESLGSIGCPAAVVTDDILRDELGLKSVLMSVFPEVMGDPARACIIVQDPIHRRYGRRWWG